MNFSVGSYMQEEENNIFACELNFHAQNLYPLGSAGKKPSFLTKKSDGSYIYVVNELSETEDASFGRVAGLKRNRRGLYSKVNELSTQGNYPCHLLLSKNERLLFVTNYGSAFLLVISLTENGDLKEIVQQCHFEGSSIHTERQEASHPHQTLVSPCGNFLFVSDLGSDCIYRFFIDEEKDEALRLLDTMYLSKGLGPRHMTFSDCNRFLYMSCELSSSILVFTYHAQKGILNQIQHVAAFEHEKTPYPRTSASELAYYKGQVFLANRGDDSISCFQQGVEGKLQLREHVNCEGSTPRHFKIFSHGLWVEDGTMIIANQDSQSIAVFRVTETNLIFIRSIKVNFNPSCIV